MLTVTEELTFALKAEKLALLLSKIHCFKKRQQHFDDNEEEEIEDHDSNQYDVCQRLLVQPSQALTLASSSDHTSLEQLSQTSASGALTLSSRNSFSSDQEDEEEEDQQEEESEQDLPPPTCVTVTLLAKSSSSSRSSSSSPPPLKRLQPSSFTSLRVTYLLVTLVIMLADGMQGTHLYVLYESYGYSVASLYCLGFLTGGLMSPITGPLIDRIGRKKSAILYCLLEMIINAMEQYPYLMGLIASRMIGGFTTNLLNQVFETWLDTEYRRRGLEKEKYEIIMRDSVIVSNLAAIFSGYLSHVLADTHGAKGPFRGAVCCTGIALVVVATVWTENYGGGNHDSGCDATSTNTRSSDDKDKDDNQEDSETKDMMGYFREAVAAFRADPKMRRVGLIQGLSAGSVQIFIFLWAPALRELARSAAVSSSSSSTAKMDPLSALGLDHQGEPAYGIIFGAFMAAGVLGGIIAPPLRRAVTHMLSPPPVVGDDDDASLEVVQVDGEEMKVRPMAVEFLAAFCYMVSAVLLLVPCFFTATSTSTITDSNSFSVCLAAFLVLELLIGVFLPCEGVIRSLYFPASARASVMSLPRIIVNGAVSIGVVSTNFVSLQTAFAAVATMMVVSAILQLTLISSREWSSLWSRFQSLLFPTTWPSMLSFQDVLGVGVPPGRKILPVSALVVRGLTASSTAACGSNCRRSSYALVATAAASTATSTHSKIE